MIFEQRHGKVMLIIWTDRYWDLVESSCAIWRKAMSGWRNPISCLIVGLCSFLVVIAVVAAASTQFTTARITATQWEALLADVRSQAKIKC